MAEAPDHLGPIFGAVDVADPDRVNGWVVDYDSRTAPVATDNLVEGVCVARTLANPFRYDLCIPQIGNGFHAFDVELPRCSKGHVEVRRSDDHLLVSYETCAVVARAA